MSRYLTVLEDVSAEFTEKRSRFIATLKHCETEQEAVSFIEQIRSKYWDAKHNVFAFSVESGRVSRFSDDGEPHGTAGKPIFDVLSGSGLTDVAIVVTRYFGGILLGTGGLVRAYSQAARDVFDAAKIAEMISCTVFVTECEYTDHQRLVSLIEKSNGVIEDIAFTDKVEVKYAFKDSEAEAFLLKLSESFSARLKADALCKKTVAFKI